MKLKHLAKIDYGISKVFVLLATPFWLSYTVLKLLTYPLQWLLDWVAVVHQRITNWLARQSDEVKDGTICNPHYLRNCTAKQLYKLYTKEKSDVG